MKQIFTFLFVMFLLSQATSAAIIDTTHIYGLTVDDITNLKGIDTSLARLCKKPTTRIVFDEGEPTSYYTAAVNDIHKFSFILGELVDSYYMIDYTLATFQTWVNQYFAAFSNTIDIWEVGNEVNGEWNGTISDVVAKVNYAYTTIKAAGKKTELTLYYNKVCYSSSKNEMFYWVNTNLPAVTRNGLDYVLISYYEDDCNNYQPNWQQVFDSLHVLFPNAKLGMGECGTSIAANKVPYINRYYKMNITTRNYIGGYFWWYYYEDCVPYTNALWTTFNNAIGNYACPTIQASNITYTILNSTSISLGWTSGNGSSRAIFLKDGTTGTPAITDGATYTANTTFGSGTSDGNGWYCVYNGSAAMAGSTTVTGLTSGHTYRAMVVEYNGFSGFQGYDKNTGTNNPVNITGPLPVELLTFTSNVVNNNISLNWVTSKEINNDGFSIERSPSGIKENWSQAGFVKGKGNSNSPVTYNYEDNNLATGKYKYRLKQIDFNGDFAYLNLPLDVTVGVPAKFGMSQNFPNPFNPTTNISFNLSSDSKVSLKIYDIRGREITTLVDEPRAAGYYTVSFEASHLSSCVYFYK